MATMCPYCNIEVSESSIEAEDGCCPECGSVITVSSFMDDADADEYDDEEGGAFDDLDDEDFMEDDDLDGVFDDDLDAEFDEDIDDDF